MKPMSYSLLALTFCLGTNVALAQRQISYPAVYPFVPENVNTIYSDLKRVTEDPGFIRNFNDIVDSGLSDRRTKEKPWTSSYWPLSKGTIADPYEDSDFNYWVDVSWLVWENNYKGFQKRLEKKLSKVDEMSEEELAKLAPSEKYDLLLGDYSFDLTRRLWGYMYMWGKDKENAFVKQGGIILSGENTLDLARDYVSNNFYSSVEDAFQNSWTLKPTLSAERALQLVAEGKYNSVEEAFSEALAWAEHEADNYVLADKNSRLAVWEGICNGWATAAGLVPRPRRSVSFKLPNGKNLKFYPEDIKGLVSLYYVNSLVQDSAMINSSTGLPSTQGTVSAGLRCNLKNPKKDIWGRFYDDRPDPKSGSSEIEARCNGVHPATWHLGLVNLIGKQNRSFIVERKVGAAVDNHPMWGYEFKYFNPNTGRSEKNLNKNIERIDKDDQFLQFRHPRARYIVGVQNTTIYMNYDTPGRKETNSEKDDKEVEHKMIYDLELDENFNIVGGQWRAVKVGYAPERNSYGYGEKINQNQPDFFWTITKNYKSTGWFKDEPLAPWTDKSTVPPASWLSSARSYHSFIYQQTIANEKAATCYVKHKETGKTRTALCEMETNRPQPLINVVNALIELSK